MIKKQTDEFLEEVKKIAPISERFLKRSREIVEKMFTDVPEQHLEMCKKEMIAIFKHQAEVEEILQQARSTLNEAREGCKRIIEEKEKGKISIKPVNLKSINLKSD